MKVTECPKGKWSVFAGVLVLLFDLLAFFACISYLLTWREDQSLLDVPAFFDECMRVENVGGAFGYAFGHFLMGICFGFGAFMCLGVIGAVAVKLILRKDINWFKAGFLAIPGAFLLSCLLAYAGDSEPFIEWNSLFEGGFGGSCGSFAVMALNAMFGVWFTPAILAVFLGLLVYMCVDVTPSSSRYKAAAETEMVSEVEQEEPEEVEEDAEDGGEEDTEVEEETEEEEAEGELEDVPAVDDGPEVQQPELTVNGPEEVLDTEVTEELPSIDIKSDMDRYCMPSLDLLEDYANKRFSIPQEEIDRNLQKIKSTLASFKIPVSGISASVGYTVTLYKITLGDGVRVNSIKNLEEDIAIKIGIKGVRVVILADAVGIEVPNEKPSVVPLKAILNSDTFRNSKGELPIGLGYTITTKAKVFDLADAPHLLVAGATKQGKSVGLNAIIASLLYSKHPTELKFVFIDPKMVEFQKYSKLFKHYLAALPPEEETGTEADDAIVKDAKSAERVLRSLCVEMDQRYKLMSAAGVNNVIDYNEKYLSRHLMPTEGHQYFPYIVIVVDEYADLTKSTFGNDRNTARSIENSINRLAAKGRAGGLHIIIATQRPSVDVITGTIKGNFPTRMAFRTAQRQDSMTILGMPGAERLIGKGDMLFFTGADAERVQCALIDSDEIDALTKYIAKQDGYHQCCGAPYKLPDPGDGEVSGEAGVGGLVDMSRLDELFEEAAKLSVVSQSISTSMLQRKMNLGFARAGRLVDQLEAAGILGPQQGSKPREVLVPDLATLQPILDAFLHR